MHQSLPNRWACPPLDPAAYLLNAAAVRAHLSAHVHEGRVTFEIQNQRPIWRRLA